MAGRGDVQVDNPNRVHLDQYDHNKHDMIK